MAGPQRQRSHALARLRALFHGQEKQALMRALNTWKAAHRNLQRNTEHSEVLQCRCSFCTTAPLPPPSLLSQRRRGLGLRFLTRWAQATAQRNKLSAFLHWWRCTLQLREQEARVAADNRTKLVSGSTCHLSSTCCSTRFPSRLGMRLCGTPMAFSLVAGDHALRSSPVGSFSNSRHSTLTARNP